jgi:hypothetical protein
MAAPRKRGIIARRRRLDEEDNDMTVATEMADDSQSDMSGPSEGDADADADNSDLSGDDNSAPSLANGKSRRKTNSARDTKPRPSQREPSPPIARSDSKFMASKDTEMMMNGLQVGDETVGDAAVDVETGNTVVEPAPASAAQPARPESFAERKRREHEEYKKKRDSDPAFIPNRGAFFMHDQRSMPGQNGFRPALRGGPRARGRGPMAGPYAPVK